MNADDAVVDGLKHSAATEDDLRVFVAGHTCHTRSDASVRDSENFDPTTEICRCLHWVKGIIVFLLRSSVDPRSLSCSCDSFPCRIIPELSDSSWISPRPHSIWTILVDEERLDQSSALTSVVGGHGISPLEDVRAPDTLSLLFRDVANLPAPAYVHRPRRVQEIYVDPFDVMSSPPPQIGLENMEPGEPLVVDVRFFPSKEDYAVCRGPEGCGRIVPMNPAVLTDHVRDRHLALRYGTQGLAPRKVRCIMEGCESLQRFDSLARHLKRKDHMKEIHVCPLCDNSYSRKDALSRHITDNMCSGCSGCRTKALHSY